MYLLSRHANISLTESLMLPDFEREAYINLLLEDMEKEAEAFKT